jgi:hypothetical protein
MHNKVEKHFTISIAHVQKRGVTLVHNKHNDKYTYIHTYHSHFILEGVAELSQILLRDAHVLPNYSAMSTTADVTGSKLIAVLLLSISGISADIHGRKREGLFFYFVPDTTREMINIQ